MPMTSTSLIHVARPASGDPDGLLVLHHGRGSDERDLIDLADTLDPEGRLHVVAPRAPLTLGGSPGFHWYVVPRVGYPDPATFRASLEALGAFHDELFERTGLGPAQTVLGGFSMGSVMSFATGLDRSRPPVAGILGLSGFVPVVLDWQPDLVGRPATRVFIGHGAADAVIPVDFARRADELLSGAGFDVDYHEHGGGHWIDPALVEPAVQWLANVLPARTAHP